MGTHTSSRRLCHEYLFPSWDDGRRKTHSTSAFQDIGTHDVGVCHFSTSGFSLDGDDGTLLWAQDFCCICKAWEVIPKNRLIFWLEEICPHAPGFSANSCSVMQFLRAFLHLLCDSSHVSKLGQPWYNMVSQWPCYVVKTKHRHWQLYCHWLNKGARHTKTHRSALWGAESDKGNIADPI